MTTFDLDDTIVAIASPPGGALRGIIRVSGPQTLTCLRRICFDESNHPVSNRQINSRAAIDCHIAINDQTRLPGRLLVWPDYRSYTRQPMVEFHTVGSPPLLEMATAAICKSGARLAERGEFTLRAFLSGRIDLTQAEAVLAVIDSDNQVQLKNALAQLSGGLASPLARIRETLIGVLAELEAGLDFVEEDIEFITADELSTRLTEAGEMLSELNEQIRNRNVSRRSFDVALIGHPNAGKSSLFNTLLSDDRAIVADIEGTTRDFVTAIVNWDDLDVRLIDTAGLDLVAEESAPSQAIHSQAQRHSHQQLKQSDIIVCCIPVTSSADDLAEIAHWSVSKPGRSVIPAVTKSDLSSPAEHQNLTRKIAECLKLTNGGDQVIATSSLDSTGIEKLKRAIIGFAKQKQNDSASFVNSTATRTAASLEAAETAIQLALQAVRENIGLEIVAAELRRALDELGSVVGTVYTDDILDQIFSRFCIGK